ncbi:MAG TPA: aminotransferase class I/II-fold pyridoxal phosphate-dependent enzyme [Paraburkholderia sp.]|jgi:8-amino-7-oxononanoate synthase
MLDFASALYLGMRHPSAQTGGYDALTTGTPAALASAPLANQLAARAAALQGCEAGVVAPSTLHLAVDVFDRLGRTHALIADDALYPVTRWGLQRVMGLGVPVDWFRHGDCADLTRRILQRRLAKPPAVIADATSADGAPAPLARYLALVRGHGGLVAIDQSQLLGLLGERASPAHPWGFGGGGVLRHAALDPFEPILLIASWAKAFGAPLATLCGPLALVGAIARDAPTQTHCSAASQSAMLAAMNALAINEQRGDALRATLLQRISRLERGLRWLARTRVPDLRALRRQHPLQQLRLGSAERTLALHAGLRASGLRTALLRECGPGYTLAVVTRANHGTADIDALIAAIAAIAPRLPGAPHAAAPAATMEEREHVQDFRG